AGRAAGALALAARAYRAADPPFAATCLREARRIYQLGRDHPGVRTTRPADFYPEETWIDDMTLAASLLHRVTGEDAYLADALAYARRARSGPGGVDLYNVYALANADLAPQAPDSDRRRLLGYLRDECDLARKRARDPFWLGAEYTWGTAAECAGAG